MRKDAATILMGMGYNSETEFEASADDLGNVSIKWLSANPQPTEAEIDAATIASQRAAIAPVTRKQMLIALHRVGLLEPIKAAVTASGDIELQIAFDEALTFERNDAFLAAMQAAMQKTDEEVDGIFQLAASI